MASVQHSPAPRVAVLLNANASQVTARMAARLARVAGTEHVYTSRSLEEAEQLAETLVDRGYTDIVVGGGDGSLVNAIEGVRRAAQNRAAVSGLQPPAPRFGLLPLGTGNALRSVVAARHPERDLQAMVQGAAGERGIDWIGDAEGRHFFFAGVGHTAQVLHDYNKVRTALPRWLLPAQAAYGLAVLCRTVPRYLFSKHPRHARIVTRSEAYRVEVNAQGGRVLTPVPAGELLYEGRVGTLDVGTVPELGCRIRMFPFADSVPGTMQLRVSSLSLAASLWNMPSVWRGSLRKPGKLHDFLVKDVDVQLDKATTYQHSGDEQGRTDSLRFTIEPESLRILVRGA